MNTKYIYKISNYLFICMLALAVFACKDDDNSEDTSASYLPTLQKVPHWKVTVAM